MKNLKKLISVIIAVMMLVSSFAAVSAADYADVESTDGYYKAIKVLSGLGIATGDDEGNFNPDNDVKRSEMVTFLCRALGEEDIAKASATNVFSDVAANHWAVGYIAWGVNNGIIKGMGDGTFAPDASVSYQDAVVMIMRALGYEHIAQKNGGYPTGYLKYASQNNVLKGAGYDNQAAAPRKIIAQLIYNALTAPTVTLEYTTEGEKYVINKASATKDPQTLLTDVNGVVKVKASIEATPKTDASTYIDKAGNYMVKIKVLANGTYEYNAAALKTKLGCDGSDEVVVYAGETEAADLLAATVEAYLVEDEDLNDWKLVALVADAKSVVEETVVAADVTTVSYTSNVFTYLDENDKEVEIDTVAAPTVYFNGKVLPSDKITYTGASDLEDLLVNIADQITFAGAKNSDYDKIFVTDYQYAKVVEVMADEEFIKIDINGSETAIDLSEEGSYGDAFIYGIYDAEGNAIEIADIAEGDILNVVAPLADSNTTYDFTDSDLEYMDIYVSNETVTGRVEGEVVSGVKYVIDGAVYKLATGVSVNLGDEGTYYLTIDGKVLDYEADSTIAKNYAFVVAHDTETSFGVTTHIVKVFNADGTFETLTLAPSVNVYLANPNNSYTYEKVVAKRADGSQDTLGAYLDGFLADHVETLAIANEGNDSDKEAADTAAREWVRDALQARVMTYAVNADGEIKEMRFAGTGTDEFAATEADGADYIDDIAVFAGADLSDKSVLFVAPIAVKNVTVKVNADGTLNAAGTEKTRRAYYIDEDKLKIASFDALDEEKSGGYNAYLFNFDNEEYLGAAILGEEIAASGKFANLAVVQSKISTVDAEGTPVDKYTFVQGGEVLKLTVDADYSAPTLEAGDIFRYTVNVAGDIDYIEHIYDADGISATAGSFSTSYGIGSLNSNKIAIVYGKITEIKSGKMTLDATGITGGSVPATKLTFATGEGFTYASIDEARVNGAANPASGVKALAGAGNLKASYGSNNFYVVAIVNENNRFEDCVMIIK